LCRISLSGGRPDEHADSDLYSVRHPDTGPSDGNQHATASDGNPDADMDTWWANCDADTDTHLDSYRDLGRADEYADPDPDQDFDLGAGKTD